MDDLILLVEDDNVTAYIIMQRLRSRGFNNIWLADSYETTLMAVKKHRPNIILMDININGDINGVETAKAIHQNDAIPVIFISGTTDLHEIRAAKSMPFCHFFYKPLDFALFFDVVERLLQHDPIHVVKR
jgi:DNA-binding NtrC family response regulator